MAKVLEGNSGALHADLSASYKAFGDADGAVAQAGPGYNGAPSIDGFQYLRNRWYDPGTGRFTQEDPIGFAGGINLYAYAGSNPVSYADPLGLCPDSSEATGARGKGRDVVIECSDGSQEERSGGTRAWRNNNPGNIRNSDFARNQGSVGQAGGFAVFGDAAKGQKALTTLLQTPSYQNLTLAGAIARYAPSSENNTQAYQQGVQKATGIDLTTSMSSLGRPGLRAVATAIGQHEGWIPGRVTIQYPGN